MSYLRTAAATLLAAAAALSACSRAREAASCRGCDVLLVTIDTLRVDRVGAYGGRAGLTPALDRLAAAGVRVEHAYTPAPLTLPAHASLLTGRLPPRHGARDNGIFRVDEATASLGSLLRAEGVATGAFVGSFVLDSRFGLAAGFDEYDDRYTARPGGPATAERRADEVVDAALTWIRARRASADRWFAWVHLYDPHAPYDPPPGGPAGLDPYDGEVAYADRAVARLVDALGPGGDRLVVVTSDHGESLGAHGEATHGIFAYDVTMRVPLVFVGFGGRPGSVVQGPVSLVDVMPTMLEALGVAVPPDLDGRSLGASLVDPERRAGAPVESRPIYLEALHGHLTRGWAPLTGIVSDGFKYIALPKAELYHLSADPLELNNVHDREPARAGRLRDRLAGLSRELEHAAAPGRPVAPTEGARRALQSLGYTAGPVVRSRATFTEADDPKTLMALGRAIDEAAARYARGEEAAALTALEALAVAHPEDPRAAVALADIYRRLDRRADAIAVLERAVAHGPDPSVVLHLASDLAAASRHAEALAHLERVIGERPDYLDARVAAGVTLGQMGRVDEARVAFDQVLALDPTAATALEARGVLAIGRGALDEAEADLRQALARDATLAHARASLAFVCARTGRVDEAVALWREALGQEPDDLESLFNLALALDEQGRSAEAAPHFSRFLALAPPERFARQRAQAAARLENAPAGTRRR